MAKRELTVKKVVKNPTIREIRETLGMSQADFAELLGVAVVTYSNKERGVCKFYFNEVKKICNLAKISLDIVRV